MAKYAPEFKLEIVKKVIEDGRPVGTIAKEYQVSKGLVQTWAAAYKAHGVTGLGKKQGKYTGEFKQQVIEDMHTNKLSLRQTAAKYNLAQHKIVSNWERIYFEEGPEGLYKDRRSCANVSSGTRKGRPPKLEKKVEEDLIAEVQRLRAENDYLKKLNALVSERVQREKKHKS